MFNPWIILAGIVAVIALCAGSAYEGHTYGVDAQKVADQVQFDKIEAERTKQKAEANSIYQTAQANIITLQTERDKLKTTLEANDAQHRKITNDLSAKYSGLQLRFKSAQSAGNRPNSGSAVSGSSNTACPDAAPIVQLPDTVAKPLRQLALDADRLRDEYAKCFAYVTQVK